MALLKVLDLETLPIEQLTVALANSRLQRVLTPSTRRKHAINLRATLGLKVPCPRPQQKSYDLPPIETLVSALTNSSYENWGLVMLFR